MEGLDHTLRRLVARESSAREALQLQQAQLLESMTSERRRRERWILALIATAALMSGISLVLSLL
jgi:sugar diacid utilization regulator